jgi:cell division protein FtsN
MESEEIQSESAKRIIQKLREIEEAQKREEVEEPENRGWFSNLVPFFVILILLGASFWVSFLLGQRLLLPSKASKTTVDFSNVPSDAVAPERLEEVLKHAPKNGKLVFPPAEKTEKVVVLADKQKPAAKVEQKTPLVPEVKINTKDLFKTTVKASNPVLKPTLEVGAKVGSNKNKIEKTAALEKPQPDKPNLLVRIWNKLFPPKSEVKELAKFEVEVLGSDAPDLVVPKPLERSTKKTANIKPAETDKTMVLVDKNGNKTVKNYVPVPVKVELVPVAMEEPVVATKVLRYSSKQAYYVQAGAFKIKTNAENLISNIRAQGFTAILRYSSGLWRVNVGGNADLGQASETKKSLQNAGFDAIIIKL